MGGNSNERKSVCIAWYNKHFECLELRVVMSSAYIYENRLRFCRMNVNVAHVWVARRPPSTTVLGFHSILDSRRWPRNIIYSSLSTSNGYLPKPNIEPKKNQKKNEKEPPKTKTTTKKPLRVLYRSLMHLPCYTLFANRLSQTVTVPWTHRQTEAFASNVRCINFLDSITTMFYAIVRFAPRARALLRLHCTSMHLI